MADFSKLLEEKNLITFALVLIIILGVLSYNLYVNSNTDVNGGYLGCWDTLRNIFGILPVIAKAIEDVVDTTVDVIEDDIKATKKAVKRVFKKKPN